MINCFVRIIFTFAVAISVVVCGQKAPPQTAVFPATRPSNLATWSLPVIHPEPGTPAAVINA